MTTHPHADVTTYAPLVLLGAARRIEAQPLSADPQILDAVAEAMCGGGGWPPGRGGATAALWQHTMAAIAKAANLQTACTGDPSEPIQSWARQTYPPTVASVLRSAAWQVLVDGADAVLTRHERRFGPADTRLVRAGLQAQVEPRRDVRAGLRRDALAALLAHRSHLSSADIVVLLAGILPHVPARIRVSRWAEMLDSSEYMLPVLLDQAVQL